MTSHEHPNVALAREGMQAAMTRPQSTTAAEISESSSIWKLSEHLLISRSRSGRNALEQLAARRLCLARLGKSVGNSSKAGAVSSCCFQNRRASLSFPSVRDSSVVTSRFPFAIGASVVLFSIAVTAAGSISASSRVESIANVGATPRSGNRVLTPLPGVSESRFSLSPAVCSSPFHSTGMRIETGASSQSSGPFCV